MRSPNPKSTYHISHKMKIRREFYLNVLTEENISCNLEAAFQEIDRNTTKIIRQKK